MGRKADTYPVKAFFGQLEKYRNEHNMPRRNLICLEADELSSRLALASLFVCR